MCGSIYESFNGGICCRSIATFAHSRKEVYLRTFETFVVTTPHWGTRNEQKHAASLSCRLPPRALDPLSLPAPFPLAPLPKSRPPTHLRLRSPPPTAAPQLPASRALAGLTFFCYWLQNPPARKVPLRPARRPLAAPPTLGKWPITKVIRRALAISTFPGSAGCADCRQN